MTEDRERRTYRHRTQGIKGAKLPRINMAFDPDVYEFIREQSGRECVTMTKFVNDLLRERMAWGREEGYHGEGVH